MAFHLGKLAQVPISHLRTDTYMSGRSYTSQFEEEDGHDMKLTRIDCNTGKVEIVDEFKLNSPLIYLCKIDEEHFLSYYVVKAPSKKIEYATLTVATIYSLDGTKKEIIREIYENDVDWTDSEGTLIERFAVKDGEIYGFGRPDFRLIQVFSLSL